MFDIENMSDEDELHNISFGMQSLTQNELGRQKVQDMPSDITVADALIDFCFKNIVSNPTPSKIKNKEKGRYLKKDNQRKEENDKGKGMMDATTSNQSRLVNNLVGLVKN